MSKKVKVFSFVLSFVMIVLLSVGTTLALLTDKTDGIKNTFTAATKLLDDEATFVIQEHTVNGEFVLQKDDEHLITDGQDVVNDYVGVFPGIDVGKDPTVYVGELVADAYLFVVLEEQYMTAADDADFFSWTIGDNWIKVGTKTEVNKNFTLYAYKKTVDETSATKLTVANNPLESAGVGILKDDKVVVKNYTIAQATANPQYTTDAYMTVSAYLVQAFGVNVSDNSKACAVFKGEFTTEFTPAA